MSSQKKQRTVKTTCENFINGKFKSCSSGNFLDVTNPATGEVIGKCGISTIDDVNEAVAAAKAAFPAWSGLTVKTRAAKMFKLHHLINEHMDELSELVVQENGKNATEAVGDVAKGNETVEWACSIPQLAPGGILQVSRGITCHEVRSPLGVVAAVVPFNFPAMVPLWTTPIALTMGNCVILKPSEKVPLTMTRMAELIHEAGIPPGVFQIVHGTAPIVTALCDHTDIAAVTFVGSSKVAEIVHNRCRERNKKVLALGGAKNYLVALNDCDVPMCANDICASFAGCAGQRCMAASVLLLVGDTGNLLDEICAKARALKPGQERGQVGPVIDAASRDRIIGYIDQAESQGCKLLVDGRSWAKNGKGTWVGPTIIMHTNKDDSALSDEIFGPVLSVLKVDTWEEALALENACDYGNAAAIYTSVGSHAEHFVSRFRAGMIGVNIGIPVPREPFSFGGLYGTKSKFGDMDITGDGAMEFFSSRRKVTTKWSKFGGGQSTDKANFAGAM
jgi:methylmalonic acid semialdehyde dehydrogenase